MRSTLSIPLVSGLILASLSVPARAQSLGDLAREEAERRKTVKEAAKVLTNKDLPTVIPSGASPAPVTPDAAANPDAKTDDTKESAKGDATKDDGKDGKGQAAKDEPKDQKYWASRLKALQEALSRDEAHVQAMETQVNSLQTDFVNRDDPAQRATIAADRQKAIEERDRLKKAIVDDKKAIDDFEEEARRASVPPGWLR